MQLYTVTWRCYLEPDKPLIENIEMGYDFVNVSWRSSVEEPSTNPASEFVVEYQLQQRTFYHYHARQRIPVFFRFSFRSYLQ